MRFCDGSPSGRAQPGAEAARAHLTRPRRGALRAATLAPDVGGRQNPLMSIVIRPLSPADEAEWRRLWTLYLEFYETTVPEAVYAASFARNLSADHPDMNALVADRPDGSGLIGLVHYIFHRHNWREEDVVYLQDLYVDAQVRGGGVGRRSKHDVEREMGYEALRAAVRARGFHLLECGDHYLVVCTARRMRIHR